MKPLRVFWLSWLESRTCGINQRVSRSCGIQEEELKNQRVTTALSCNPFLFAYNLHTKERYITPNMHEERNETWLRPWEIQKTKRIDPGKLGSKIRYKTVTAIHSTNRPWGVPTQPGASHFPVFGLLLISHFSLLFPPLPVCKAWLSFIPVAV